MIVEILGFLASVWTLLQPLTSLLKQIWNAFGPLLGNLKKRGFAYRVVSVERLSELENREAALQLLVEQLDASRTLLGPAEVKRRAQ